MRDIRYLACNKTTSSDSCKKKYADVTKLKTMQELQQQFFPELIVITDGTEQPAKTERSYQKKKSYYSGKKKEKTHTIQNQIAINLDRVIICKSAFSRQSS